MNKLWVRNAYIAALAVSTLFRVVIAIIIDTAFVMRYPLTLAGCKSGCVESALCALSCTVRHAVGLGDIGEYLVFDTVSANPVRASSVGAMYLFFTSPGIAVVTYLYIVRSRYARLTGSIVATCALSCMFQLVWEWALTSPNLGFVLLCNMVDLIWPWVLLAAVFSQTSTGDSTQSHRSQD